MRRTRLTRTGCVVRRMAECQRVKTPEEERGLLGRMLVLRGTTPSVMPRERRGSEGRDFEKLGLLCSLRILVSGLSKQACCPLSRGRAVLPPCEGPRLFRFPMCGTVKRWRQTSSHAATVVEWPTAAAPNAASSNCRERRECTSLVHVSKRDCHVVG